MKAGRLLWSLVVVVGFGISAGAQSISDSVGHTMCAGLPGAQCGSRSDPFAPVPQTAAARAIAALTRGPSPASGNALTPGTVNYTYDENDRLVSVNGAALGYDGNGNLKSSPDGTTYDYDFEDRLTRVTKPDGTVIEHAYDADGNRVQTRVTPPGGPTQVTNYLVDPEGRNGLPEVVAESDQAGNLQAYCVRGDDLLSVMRASGTRFYHADGLGSIRRLTDETGNITDGYTYDAYGSLIAHTGTDPQPYTFAGEPYDPNSGFYYNRARWMDPGTGRFVGMDPFAGSPSEPATLHRYLYAWNNPINRSDPSGLDPDLVTLNVFDGMLSSVLSTAVPNRNAFLPDAITYSVLKDQVIFNPAEGYYKQYKARIGARGAGDRLLVVQWVQGYRKLNGRFVQTDRFHGMDNVEANFPDWNVDSRERVAEYSADGLTKTGNHIDFFDNPGTHRPLRNGEAFENQLQFKVNLYDKRRYGALAFDSFLDPNTPSPLLSRDWSFVGSQQVP